MRTCQRHLGSSVLDAARAVERTRGGGVSAPPRVPSNVGACGCAYLRACGAHKPRHSACPQRPLSARGKRFAPGYRTRWHTLRLCIRASGAACFSLEQGRRAPSWGRQRAKEASSTRCRCCHCGRCRACWLTGAGVSSSSVHAAGASPGVWGLDPRLPKRRAWNVLSWTYLRAHACGASPGRLSTRLGSQDLCSGGRCAYACARFRERCQCPGAALPCAALTAPCLAVFSVRTSPRGRVPVHPAGLRVLLPHAQQPDLHGASDGGHS